MAYSNKGKLKHEATLEWRGWYVFDTYLVFSTVEPISSTVEAMNLAAFLTLGIDPLQPHGIYPNCVALKFKPHNDANDKRRFLIDVEWGPPDQSLLSGNAQIRVGATVKYQSTNKDGAGYLIEVAYTYPDEAKYGIAAGKTYTTGKTIQVMKPEKVLEFNILSDVNPEILADTLVGTVNFAMWKFYAAGTVLCTGIIGISTDWGVTWRVKYLFQFNFYGFTQTVAYTDMVTGKPPADLVQDTGLVDILPYPTGNFNLLTEI